MLNIIVIKGKEKINNFTVDPDSFHQTMWDMFGMKEVKVKFRGRYTIVVELLEEKG